MKYLSFLRGMIVPLVEAYSITALSLDKLVNRQLLENEFIMDVLAEMKRQLVTGSLKYGELCFWYNNFIKCGVLINNHAIFLTTSSQIVLMLLNE